MQSLASGEDQVSKTEGFPNYESNIDSFSRENAQLLVKACTLAGVIGDGKRMVTIYRGLNAARPTSIYPLITMVSACLAMNQAKEALHFLDALLPVKNQDEVKKEEKDILFLRATAHKLLGNTEEVSKCVGRIQQLPLEEIDHQRVKELDAIPAHAGETKEEAPAGNPFMGR